jgi:hypothetical protein
MTGHSRLAVAALVVVSLLSPSSARAEPWFGWGQTKTEDRYENGDLDIEDLLDGSGVRGAGGVEHVRTGTWISIGAFWRTLFGGYQDVGVTLVASVPFDRLGRGSAHLPGFVGDGTSKSKETAAPPDPVPVPPPPTGPPTAPADEPARLVVTPGIARRAVVAAWKASGLGVDDRRIDSMVARARSSAALPEARFRAMRVFLLDGSQSTVIPIDTSSYETAGATLVLEGRLTWRLDRLLYADDEPSLERLRVEREDARSKLAGKVLEALFQWQRAWLAVHTVKPGTREASEAAMRLIEAEATLDVMTAGWFGAWVSALREDDP